MKLLQVSAYETPGSRFNGLQLSPALKDVGINSKHIVWEKDTNNPEVLTFGGLNTHKVKHYISKLESSLSLQSVLYPHALQLIRTQAFKEADVIHLHIIHNGYISMRHLAKISKLKPTVWTLHDPWALTGHCLHPLDCNRWMTGCGECPDLETPLPIKRDTTKWLFKHKKRAYEKSNLELIVSSDWMAEMIEKSPMFKNKKIHKVPFGVDLNFFNPKFTDFARKILEIPKDHFVLCFRADSNIYKGFDYIVNALENLKNNRPITLIALNSNSSKLDHLKQKFNIIEIGWSNDAEKIRNAISACNLFLMPSLAESFGLMAVEAMACGKPIIVFEGTALTSVTRCPEVGFSVPKHDYLSLAKKIDELILKPEMALSHGKKGRRLAEVEYCEELQVKRLKSVYNEVFNSFYRLNEVN